MKVIYNKHYLEQLYDHIYEGVKYVRMMSIFHMVADISIFIAWSFTHHRDGRNT